MKIKNYKKTYDYTYTLGVFETIEALHQIPNQIQQVYLHSQGSQNEGYQQILTLCQEHQIPYDIGNQVISRISKKDNCFAIAVIKKYSMKLENTKHVLLVNPSDMGNIGTILRTMLGFEYTNLAIIKPAVDIFNPKVLRSSMGAVFKINIEYFDGFSQYQERFPNRDIYPLMLQGATNIHQLVPNKERQHTLIFGNESSGLPEDYASYGTSLFIPHSTAIDSLNVSIAVGITLLHFSKEKYHNYKTLQG